MNENELTKKFGIAIRRLRLDAGISQEKLADLCNLHRTYIGTIERGEKRVTITTANKLAAALGISLSELFKAVEKTSVE